MVFKNMFGLGTMLWTPPSVHTPERTSGMLPLTGQFNRVEFRPGGEPRWAAVENLRGPAEGGRSFLVLNFLRSTRCCPSLLVANWFVQVRQQFSGVVTSLVSWWSGFNCCLALPKWWLPSPWHRSLGTSSRMKLSQTKEVNYIVCLLAPSR